MKNKNAYLYVVALGMFIGFSASAEVNLPSYPSTNSTLTKCTVNQISQNLVASRLFGKWRMQIDLTSRLTDHIAPGTTMEAEFLEDESVAELFNTLKDKVDCYFTQGQTASRIKTIEGSSREVSSPFILVSINGNSVLIVDESGYSGEGPINFHPLNITIARAAESANDILFIGGDSNNQGLVALTRSEE